MRFKKRPLPILLLLCLLAACKVEPHLFTAPDLTAFSGNYIVSGTHYNWYYSGGQPIDSVIAHTYDDVNDTLILTKVNDSTLTAVLSDSVTLAGNQMTYKGHSSATGGYVFLWAFNGGPNYDSLVVYQATPDSVYFSFSTNLPHSGGDTYQMRGTKMN